MADEQQEEELISVLATISDTKVYRSSLFENDVQNRMHVRKRVLVAFGRQLSPCP